MIDGWGISCEIAPIWMSLDLNDEKSTLVQVMAWCRQATSHYLSQCWPRSLSPYGVIKPQWVNWHKLVMLHWHFCNRINPLRAIFFRGNINIYSCYLIAPHWHDTGSWNLSSCKTRTSLFNIVNITAADDPATQRARTSATMIFATLNRINSVLTR